MIKFIKRNKLLSILLFLTIIVILISIYLPALIDNKAKEEITNNINNLLVSIKSNNNLTKTYIYNTLLENSLSITILWTLGISIIGIPIILCYYILKLLTYILEITFLIINLKSIPIILIPIYSIPYIINIFLYFILIYYAITFSIILIKVLFLKKEYNLKGIMKKYIKLYFLLLLGITINSIIEIFLVPTLLKFFL